MDSKDEQPWKQSLPIDSAEFGIIKDWKDE
jgi:hypothetical protein